MDFRDRLSLEHPIVQAGLGGGTSGAELAAAVSRAGGLGTIGIVAPAALEREIARARQLAPGRPLAVNLLVPFVRRRHVDACLAARVEAVTLFYGFAPRLVARLRAAGVLVVHQVGTAAQARRALADGAEVLIAQGREAGGHLLGEAPTLPTLATVLEVAAGAPVLAAGGIATAAQVRTVLAAGAAAAVAGTRFLLTHESAAHPAYKQRVVGATRTVETQLFGLAWPARHRVVPNAATDRWCRRHPEGPTAVRWLERLTAPMLRLLPMEAGGALAARQSLGFPFYAPASPLAGDDDRLIEVAPLYAGECAREIATIIGAEQAVRDLAAPA